MNTYESRKPSLNEKQDDAMSEDTDETHEFEMNEKQVIAILGVAYET